MDLVKKYYLVFITEINIFYKTQYLLSIYGILTISIFFTSFFEISELFLDTLFSISNFYLIVIFNSDRNKKHNLFFKIYNVNNFLRFFVKLNILYALFIIQVIIYKMTPNEIIENNIISFYVILTTFIFCLFLLSYNVKFILKKIVVVFVFSVSFISILPAMLSPNIATIFIIIVSSFTYLYSIIKISNENSNKF